jgi:hypothetical protein
MASYHFMDLSGLYIDVPNNNATPGAVNLRSSASSSQSRALSDRYARFHTKVIAASCCCQDNNEGMLELPRPSINCLASTKHPVVNPSVNQSYIGVSKS